MGLFRDKTTAARCHADYKAANTPEARARAKKQKAQAQEAYDQAVNDQITRSKQQEGNQP